MKETLLLVRGLSRHRHGTVPCQPRKGGGSFVRGFVAYTHSSAFEVSYGEYLVEWVGVLFADNVLRCPGHPSKHFSDLCWGRMERRGIVLMTNDIIVWKALRYPLA